MEKLKREMISKDDSGLHYVVDDISTTFGVTLASMQAITKFKLTEPQRKLLNVIWRTASREYIVQGEAVFSFDNIKKRMDDSTFIKDRILSELSGLNIIIIFEQKYGITYSSLSLVERVRYNDKAILIGIDRRLIRAVMHKEIFIKKEEELDSMQSDYLRQVFLNLESERIINKLRGKSTKLIVISPFSLFYGLEINPSEVSNEDIEIILLLLKSIKFDNYLRRCKVQDDGDIAIEFFKVIKYDMNEILQYNWD